MQHVKLNETPTDLEASIPHVSIPNDTPPLINFIWIGSEFTMEMYERMLKPKILNLNHFFSKAYNNKNPIVRLTLDRNTSPATLLALRDAKVDIQYVDKVYDKLSKLTDISGKVIFTEEQIKKLRRMVTLESKGFDENDECILHKMANKPDNKQIAELLQTHPDTAYIIAGDDIYAIDTDTLTLTPPLPCNHDWLNNIKNNSTTPIVCLEKKLVLANTGNYIPKNNTDIKRIFQPNPALATDMFKFALLLIEPSIFMDIGLETYPIVANSMQWAKNCASSIINQNTGKIDPGLVFAGAKSSDQQWFDLQIMLSSATPECKKLLIAALTECMKHDIDIDSKKATERRFYGDDSARRKSSWTFYAWISAQKQLQIKPNENGTAVIQLSSSGSPYNKNNPAGDLYLMAKTTNDTTIFNFLKNTKNALFAVVDGNICVIESESLKKFPGGVWLDEITAKLDLNSNTHTNLTDEQKKLIHTHNMEHAFAGMVFKNRSKSLIADYKAERTEEQNIDLLRVKGGDDFKLNPQDTTKDEDYEPILLNQEQRAKYDSETTHKNPIAKRAQLEQLEQEKIQTIKQIQASILPLFKLANKNCSSMSSIKYDPIEYGKVTGCDLFIMAKLPNENLISQLLTIKPNAAYAVVDGAIYAMERNRLKALPGGDWVKDITETVTANAPFWRHVDEDNQSIELNKFTLMQLTAEQKELITANTDHAQATLNNLITYFDEQFVLSGCCSPYQDEDRFFKERRQQRNQHYQQLLKLDNDQALQRARSTLALLFAYKEAAEINSTYFRKKYWCAQNYANVYVSVIKNYQALHQDINDTQKQQLQELIDLLVNSKNIVGENSITSILENFLGNTVSDNSLTTMLREIMNFSQQLEHTILSNKALNSTPIISPDKKSI